MSLVKHNQVSVQGSTSKFTFSSLETGLRSISATESLPFPKRGAFSTCVSSHSHFYKIYLYISPDQAISFVASRLATPPSSRGFPESDRECKAPSTLYNAPWATRDFGWYKVQALTPCAEFVCLLFGPAQLKSWEREVCKRVCKHVLLMYAETVWERTLIGLSKYYGLESAL